jgi:hypothetical protein
MKFRLILEEIAKTIIALAAVASLGVVAVELIRREIESLVR